MKVRHLFPILAVALGIGAAHADTLYKCIDSSGVVLYTNQKDSARHCTVLSQDQPVSVYNPTPLPRHTAPPKDFPRVTAKTQHRRDDQRRKILEQELAAEQHSLAQAQQALTHGEKIRLGNEHNYQKYLDRVQKLKDNVALHQRNINAIRREMRRLP